MQIDEVIWEILTLGIPKDLERLKIMIVVLDKYSQIENSRLRSAIWQLQQDLIQIV